LTIDAGEQILIKTGDASILLKKDGTIQIKGRISSSRDRARSPRRRMVTSSSRGSKVGITEIADEISRIPSMNASGRGHEFGYLTVPPEVDTPDDPQEIPFRPRLGVRRAGPTVGLLSGLDERGTRSSLRRRLQQDAHAGAIGRPAVERGRRP
jgi:hypothetical protein